MQKAGKIIRNLILTTPLPSKLEKEILEAYSDEEEIKEAIKFRMKELIPKHILLDDIIINPIIETKAGKVSSTEGLVVCQKKERQKKKKCITLALIKHLSCRRTFRL